MSDIVDKILKLLALAHSDNANEAASAAATAQMLMVKHAVDEEDIRGRDPKASIVEPIETVRLRFYGQKIPIWEVSLSCAMAAAFFCRTYYTGSVDITAVGRRSSLDIFAATWNYVRTETERLRDLAWDKERENHRVEAERYFSDAERITRLRAMARRWRSAFCHGVVKTVGDRLNDSLKRLSAPTPSAISNSGIVLVASPATMEPVKVTALVLARQSEVDAWLKANVELRTKSIRSGHRGDVHDAYEEGRRKGRGIDLAPRATKQLGG